MELNDIKEMVTLLLDERGNSRSFTTGVIMLAPMMCNSFVVDELIAATGFTRNQVERAALNFWRNGIWTHDGAWRCEWGRIFAGNFEAITDDQLFRLKICFVLDVLVGEGSAVRTGKRQFKYQRVR